MISHAEYHTLHEGAGLLDRSGRGRLRLSGADRRSYLHGLLTNDILALAPGGGCYAALLTPQGRMVSDMRVLELGERTLIDLPGRTADAVRQRLEDFIFSEDVTVEDVRGSHVQCGLYGPRAAEILSGVLTSGDEADAARRRQLSTMKPNDNVEQQFHGEPVLVVSSDDYGIGGFEMFFAAALMEDVRRELRAAGARDVSADAVDITRVEAGRPEFGRDMDEHTIPLEAGIEDRAISLTKGCYVGQEIIIRVLHRGHGRVARRLVGLLAAPDAVFEAEDVLMAGDREIGVVTSAVVSPRLGRAIALGFVHRDHTEPGAVLAVRGRHRESVHTATVVSTPFSLPAVG
jgi:tRNA-modifying protein YgfZ